MRILLSLFALSSCLLLTLAHGDGVMRIGAHALLRAGESGRGNWETAGRMHVSAPVLLKVAGDLTRRISGAATRLSG